MTQVLIDRATLEQAIDAFELVLRNLAAGGGSKSINKLVARENAEFTKALRAALANAEPTKISLTNTSTGSLPQRVESLFEAMDKEVAAGRLVRTGPMEWSKPK